MSTQDSADAKMLAYRNLLQHATQIELLCGMLHSSTYDDTVCVERAQLQCQRKAGNRALESVGFMMQGAPSCPLPTSHHTNDLLPLPTATLPDDDATSLDHRHLICPAITAGGFVERRANCSPSHHARRDSLCRCR